MNVTNMPHLQPANLLVAAGRKYADAYQQAPAPEWAHADRVLTDSVQTLLTPESFFALPPAPSS